MGGEESGQARPPHTWDDGDRDANRAAVLDELQEAVAVVEELRDDELPARIHLQARG